MMRRLKPGHTSVQVAAFREDWLEQALIAEDEPATSIDILALTGSALSFTRRDSEVPHGERLMAQVERGAWLRVLLVSRLTHAFWISERAGFEELAGKMTDAVQQFLEKVRDCGLDHRVEVRETPWQPSMSMVLLDARLDTARGWVSPFTPDPRTKSKEKWFFELQPETEPLRFYVEQFNRLWSRAHSFAVTPAEEQVTGLRDLSGRMLRGAATLTGRSFDLAVVVALPEELRYLREVFVDHKLLALGEEDGLYELCPHPEPVDPSTPKASKMLIILLGRMGKVGGAAFVERSLQRYPAGLVVSIGIAGGLKDVGLTDVIIPSQVDDYLHRSKAEDRFNAPASAADTNDSITASAPGKPGWDLLWGGAVYRTTHSLVVRAMNVEFSKSEAWKKWRDQAKAELDEMKEEQGKLGVVAGSLLERGGPRVWADDVHLASGDILGASDEFKKRLAARDRNLLAVEMESVGMLTAASDRPFPVQSLVIRGISDNADAAKAELEDAAKGRIRRLEMHNACRFLRLLMETGLLATPPVAR